MLLHCLKYRGGRSSGIVFAIRDKQALGLGRDVGRLDRRNIVGGAVDAEGIHPLQGCLPVAAHGETPDNGRLVERHDDELGRFLGHGHHQLGSFFGRSRFLALHGPGAVHEDVNGLGMGEPDKQDRGNKEAPQHGRQSREDERRYSPKTEGRGCRPKMAGKRFVGLFASGGFQRANRINPGEGKLHGPLFGEAGQIFELEGAGRASGLAADLEGFTGHEHVLSITMVGG